MVQSAKRLLIVEDDLDIASSMESSLQKLGYTITGSVASGEEAIKEAENQMPDLILMDIMLNGSIDGLEAGKLIGSKLHIPIVYMTGHADKADAIRETGRAPLVKPFQIDDLQAAIEVFFYKSEIDNV